MIDDERQTGAEAGSAAAARATATAGATARQGGQRRVAHSRATVITCVNGHVTYRHQEERATGEGDDGEAHATAHANTRSGRD